MGKSYFFLGLAPTHPEDELRASGGPDYRVLGGSKERHERTVALVQEVSRECRKDPPQTEGEIRMILAEAAKRIG
jgi:hypothetical protein